MTGVWFDLEEMISINPFVFDVKKFQEKEGFCKLMSYILS